MSAEILLNIVVICLLIPTIVFAVILNKRLEVLRSSRNDLGRLIEAFNEATTRAEAGIPRLKQAADSTGGALKDQIQKAQTLRDDLAFMIERAENALTRLESKASAPIRAAAAASSAERAEDAEPAPKPAKTSGKQKKRPLVDDPEEIMSSAVSVVEDILRDNPPGPATASGRRKASMVSFAGDDDERSEAERELLKALRSMR